MYVMFIVGSVTIFESFCGLASRGGYVLYNVDCLMAFLKLDLIKKTRRNCDTLSNLLMRTITFHFALYESIPHDILKFESKMLKFESRE